MCSGELPIPVSGKCCYIAKWPNGSASGWACVDNVSETYCNSLYFGTFEPSGGLLVGSSGRESGVCYFDAFECTNSCFIAGTKVSLAGDFVSIEELVSGDYVQGISGETNKVIKLQKTKLGNRRLVSFNDREPFVTEDHPIFGHNGLKSFNITKSKQNYPHLVFVGELKEGDEILTNTGYEKLKTIEFVKEGASLPLYNLTLDGDHTYFANGVAVHNKSEDPEFSGGSTLCGNLASAASGTDFLSYSFRWGFTSGGTSGLALFDSSGNNIHWEGDIGGGDTITNVSPLMQTTPDTYNISIQGTVVGNYFTDATADNCVGGAGSGMAMYEDSTFMLVYADNDTELKGIN